ncbi:hypothetical protein Patl1_17856 [Pistacia atlantica]|uniref:Uncharacterized protein n=1 Tax=Pistacia atlantica TaxID=434234 RepID=A0ACC1C1Q7_9ROSI|nr:hypothetical protein Patl1_17856 [Pistacia atlantica]
MDELQQLNTWEGYVDWRNKPALRGRHGGMLAASFVLGHAANTVTNFMGTAFLLALLGGFLADAFFTTYNIYVISAVIELHDHQPVLWRTPTLHARKLKGGKAVMLFAGLYLVALGVGGIKGSLAPHGAEQFDETTQQGRKQRSAFFNYFVFCLSSGALIAVTFVVWVEDNKGWQWGFGICTATILLSIPAFLLGSPFYRTKIPIGSPITTIFKQFITPTNVRIPAKPSWEFTQVLPCMTNSESKEEEYSHTTKEEPSQIPTESLKFLNRALINNSRHPVFHCTEKEVEEVRIVLKIFPIFMSTIILNCCLAQLSTFSIQQAATMNTKLGSFKVPPASLPVFPVMFIMILAPLYNHVIIPLARKTTKTEMGITHLQRIGTGLVLSIVAMAVAALVETKRKRVAVDSGLLNSSEPLPITFLWVALQYLFLGSADLFTLAGMMEFFFTEAPISMRSLATSLSWASLAMGYYFSSVLVSIINNVTGAYRHTPWLFGSNLNHYHLERFYWLMCILSGLNFLHYLFWANRYKYRSTGP